MYNIKYKVISAVVRPGFDVPYKICPMSIEPIEEGVIGIDCATLIVPFGFFKTDKSKSSYTVLSKELDVSKDEPLLTIFVNNSKSVV